MKDFDPNDPKHAKPYATYITSRSPSFKLHSKLAAAKGALTSHWHAKSAALYDIGPDGRWRVLHEHEPPYPDICAVCALPIEQYDPYGPWQDKGRWLWCKGTTEMEYVHRGCV